MTMHTIGSIIQRMDTTWTVADLQRLHEMGVTRRKLAEVFEITDRQTRRLLTRPGSLGINAPRTTDTILFAAALGKPADYSDWTKLEHRNAWKTGIHRGIQEMARPFI